MARRPTRDADRDAKDAAGAEPGLRFRREWLPCLLLLFAVALVPRLWGGLAWGSGWDGPGSFQLVNFDEGGSCRALVGDKRYPTFVGWQVLALAELLDEGPPALGGDDLAGRRYCHSPELIRLQRGYAAVLGALSVVLVGLLGLALFPELPRVAWCAAGLLALSPFHVAESHSGTADAPQLFFTLLLVVAITWALASRRPAWLLATPLLLLAAVWTKWYVFAVFAFVPLLWSLDLRRRSVKIALAAGLLAGALFLALGFETLGDAIARRATTMLWGEETTPFGTGYAQIGTWRRWIRNAFNVPVLLMVSLGLPALAFVVPGLRAAWRDARASRARRLLWLAQSPVAVFLAYLLLLAPVTYYRHYLSLLPTAALLAGLGFWRWRRASPTLAALVFFAWPLLLTVDSELDYHLDPRRELRDFYREQGGDPRTFASFYVSPPTSARRTRLFDAGRYATEGMRYAGQADWLILSENWYDTAFANELNGPIAWRPEWLIKTRPELVRAHRRILAGEEPGLVLDRVLGPIDFMPELLLHDSFYGSFPLFVGELRVFRVVAP